MISKIILILNVLALVAALIWLYTKPEWEPLVTSLGLMAGLITQLFTKGKKDSNTIIMKQRSGNNSKNYQSKGDINING